MKKSSNDDAVETEQGPVRKRTVQNSGWKLTLLIQRMSNNNETLLSSPNDHASMGIWTPPQEHGALPLAGTRLPPPPTHFRLTQFLRADGFREIPPRNLQDNWLHTHSCADEPIAIVLLSLPKRQTNIPHILNCAPGPTYLPSITTELPGPSEVMTVIEQRGHVVIQ